MQRFSGVIRVCSEDQDDLGMDSPTFSNMFIHFWGQGTFLYFAHDLVFTRVLECFLPCLRAMNINFGVLECFDMFWPILKGFDPYCKFGMSQNWVPQKMIIEEWARWSTFEFRHAFPYFVRQTQGSQDIALALWKTWNLLYELFVLLSCIYLGAKTYENVNMEEDIHLYTCVSYWLLGCLWTLLSLLEPILQLCICVGFGMWDIKHQMKKSWHVALTFELPLR